MPTLSSRSPVWYPEHRELESSVGGDPVSDAFCSVSTKPVTPTACGTAPRGIAAADALQACLVSCIRAEPTLLECGTAISRGAPEAPRRLVRACSTCRLLFGVAEWQATPNKDEAAVPLWHARTHETRTNVTRQWKRSAQRGRRKVQSAGEMSTQIPLASDCQVCLVLHSSINDLRLLTTTMCQLSNPK